MTLVRVKGFKIFADRHGVLRCYHRQTNQKIDLKKFPIGTAGFFSECARITAASDALKQRQPKPGTLGGLFIVYFTEEHFLERSKATKKEYYMCPKILRPIQSTPISSIDTPLIAAIHDKLAKKYS